MTMSEELIKALAKASAKLATNSNGELILPCRKDIWVALGPRLTNGQRAEYGIGLQRRTILATQCGKRVIKIWNQAWPDDDRPLQMLQMAQEYVGRSLDFDATWEKANEFAGDLQNLVNTGKNIVAVYAGHATASALSTALFDENFDPQHIEPDVMDDDLDPYNWDASYYACLAYSNGAKWEENSNPTRRREFWQWYLKEAVPFAWQSVP